MILLLYELNLQIAFFFFNKEIKQNKQKTAKKSKKKTRAYLIQSFAALF